MWESFSSIVNSPNFDKFSIFVFILFCCCVVLVKTNILKINTKHVKIGDSEDRILIRNQMEYSETSCKAQLKKILPYCENEYHARFIISKVEDVFQQMIIYNHINADDECYIRSKKNLVLLTIQKYVKDEHFFSPEFRSCCDKFVEELIKDLFYMKKSMYK
jgi:hypothetical protein